MNMESCKFVEKWKKVKAKLIYIIRQKQKNKEIRREVFQNS